MSRIVGSSANTSGGGGGANSTIYRMTSETIVGESYTLSKSYPTISLEYAYSLGLFACVCYRKQNASGATAYYCTSRYNLDGTYSKDFSDGVASHLKHTFTKVSDGYMLQTSNYTTSDNYINLVSYSDSGRGTVVSTFSPGDLGTYLYGVPVGDYMYFSGTPVHRIHIPSLLNNNELVTEKLDASNDIVTLNSTSGYCTTIQDNVIYQSNYNYQTFKIYLTKRTISDLTITREDISYDVPRRDVTTNNNAGLSYTGQIIAKDNFTYIPRVNVINGLGNYIQWFSLTVDVLYNNEFVRNQFVQSDLIAYGAILTPKILRVCKDKFLFICMPLTSTNDITFHIHYILYDPVTEKILATHYSPVVAYSNTMLAVAVDDYNTLVLLQCKTSTQTFTSATYCTIEEL